jgi:hypothetical protein
MMWRIRPPPMARIMPPIASGVYHAAARVGVGWRTSVKLKMMLVL